MNRLKSLMGGGEKMRDGALDSLLQRLGECKVLKARMEEMLKQKHSQELQRDLQNLEQVVLTPTQDYISKVQQGVQGWTADLAPQFVSSLDSWLDTLRKKYSLSGTVIYAADKFGKK